MRFLFDENLSRSLCERLSDVFPGSEHVCAVGLDHASDSEVWDYAKANELTIVTKDSDFHQLSFLHGAPPKVVWLRFGNCTTEMVEKELRRETEAVTNLENDEEAAILIIERV